MFLRQREGRVRRPLRQLLRLDHPPKHIGLDAKFVNLIPQLQKPLVYKVDQILLGLLWVVHELIVGIVLEPVPKKVLF